MAMVAELLKHLEGVRGQAIGAFAFATFWAIFIEVVRRPMAQALFSAAWWPRALPNQINVMANFGYTKEKVTPDIAAYGFCWIVTMCITHIVSSVLMTPVVVLGWEAAGDTGRLLFFVGTLSEVGFDIYDWGKNFLLTFFPTSAPFLGPPMPLKIFLLMCGCHHTTVMAMAIPMNLFYPWVSAYHQIAFSLLVSAGVCYLVGQYKFTLDANTASGLAAIKKIMLLQFVCNILTRILMWFPAVYSVLSMFYSAGDTAFLVGGCFAGFGMSSYNLVVAADATMAFMKWSTKTVKGADADSKNQ